MPLTQEAIIEIQTAAAFNYKKNLRAQEEQKELKKQVEEAVTKVKSKKAKTDK